MANNIFIQFSEQDLKHLVKTCINESLADLQQKSEAKNIFLTLKEAAEYLNLAPQTLYGYTSKRSVPFIKKGKKLYFRKSDLEKWLSEGRKQTTEELKSTPERKMKGGINE